MFLRPTHLLRDIVLGVLAIIGQSTKEEHLVADEGKGVSEARAGWGAIARQPWLNSLPLPPRRLEFVQFIAAKTKRLVIH